MGSGQHEAGLHYAWNWDDTRLVCIAHGTWTVQGGFVLSVEPGHHEADLCWASMELGQYKVGLYCVQHKGGLYHAWDGLNSTRWACTGI